MALLQVKEGSHFYLFSPPATTHSVDLLLCIVLILDIPGTLRAAFRGPQWGSRRGREILFWEKNTPHIYLDTNPCLQVSVEYTALKQWWPSWTINLLTFLFWWFIFYQKCLPYPGNTFFYHNDLSSYKTGAKKILNLNRYAHNAVWQDDHLEPVSSSSHIVSLSGVGMKIKHKNSNIIEKSGIPHSLLLI